MTGCFGKFTLAVPRVAFDAPNARTGQVDALLANSRIGEGVEALFAAGATRSVTALAMPATANLGLSLVF